MSVALVDEATTRAAILTRDLAVRRLVTNGRQLRANTTTVGRGLCSLGVGRTTGGVDMAGLCLGGSTLTLLGSLALCIFLLLASLPFLANFLEFWGSKLALGFMKVTRCK